MGIVVGCCADLFGFYVCECIEGSAYISVLCFV